MAKLLVLLALCIFPALVTSVYGGNPFLVRGRLYCDTCRCGFETTATKYLAGATVRIECRDDHQNLKYSIEGVSGPDGTYEIVVPNDHADEFCDAVLVSSPDPECAVPDRGRDRARIILTRANGMVDDLRFANNMGFLKAQPLPGCTKLLKQYLETDEN